MEKITSCGTLEALVIT